MSGQNTFSLSRRDPLPTEYKGHAINTGHTSILRILRMLRDPEIDDRDRTRIMVRMFYRQPTPAAYADGFEWFVLCGQKKGNAMSDGKRDFDYEQDAQEIYSAFWQVYRIDLFSQELHWWQFSTLLNGLFACENALSNKVRLRHADDNDSQKKAAVDRAKRAAAIIEQHSITDMNLQEQLQNALLHGGDINAILNQMR